MAREGEEEAERGEEENGEERAERARVAGGTEEIGERDGGVDARGVEDAVVRLDEHEVVGRREGAADQEEVDEAPDGERGGGGEAGAEERAAWIGGARGEEQDGERCEPRR